MQIIFHTLTKGSKWQITQIWDIDVLRLNLASSTSKSSLSKNTHPAERYFKSSHHDIAIDVNVHDRHILLI